MQASWLLKEVADGQMRLVQKELAGDVSQVEPFRAFIQAMNTLPMTAGMTMLDAGCGCGHYGVLVQRFFPRITYHGTDWSVHMIANAQKLCPGRKFCTCYFSDNNFDLYDIVLTAATIEYTDYPFEALRQVLTHFKHYLILHRLRLTDGSSKHFEEPTYAGQSALHFLWNLRDIETWLAPFSYIVDKWANGTQATIVVTK
jgi:hypothetical protein